MKKWNGRSKTKSTTDHKRTINQRNSAIVFTPSEDDMRAILAQLEFAARSSEVIGHRLS